MGRSKHLRELIPGQQSNPLEKMKAHLRAWWRRLLLCLAASAVIGWSVPTVGSFVTSVAWHAVYGKSIGCEGMDIPVPLGYFAWHKGESVKMLKFGNALPPSWLTGSLITVGRAPTKLPLDVVWDRWKERAVPAFEAQGFRVTASRRVLVIGKEGSCIDMLDLSDKEQVSTDCFLIQGELDASFYGNARYRKDFYRILAGIHD